MWARYPCTFRAARVYLFIYSFVYTLEEPRSVSRAVIAWHNERSCQSGTLWTGVSLTSSDPYRFRAKREQLRHISGLLPDSQGQNLALTVLYVTNWLDSGQQLHPDEFSSRIRFPTGNWSQSGRNEANGSNALGKNRIHDEHSPG